MIPECFSIVGAVIASLGGFYYLYLTIRGKVQPSRVTWLLWGLFPMIVFIAQQAQGAEGVSWVSFAAGFTPLLIVAASFLNKKAHWKTQPRDYVLFAVAVLGIVLWYFTKDANLAILLTLIADIFAGIPTILKAAKHPESENWLAYALSVIGFTVGILSIQVFNFENAAFILTMAIMNSVIVALCLRKPFRRRA